MDLGWLCAPHFKLWQQRSPYYTYIEEHLQSTRERRIKALLDFKKWGEEHGLRQEAAEYYPSVREPHEQLQITPDNDPVMEPLYRLTFIDSSLSERKAAAVHKKLRKKPDLLVFVSYRDATCSECSREIRTGNLVFMEGREVVCLSCADLDHLVFLPSGDVAMTRRAKKHSPLSAVVLKHNRRMRRQQRVGLLVTEAALTKAEDECLEDADRRARQRQRAEVRRSEMDAEFVKEMTGEIRRLYPGCPVKTAREIAEHTGARGSGRVGRSARGRELQPKAITLAVRAHIRHAKTPYDELLYTLGDRETARHQVIDQVDQIEGEWKAES